MRRIDVLVPKGRKVDIRIRQVKGLKTPQIVIAQERVDRLPFVGSFLVKNIESLSHT
jgi:hypothetical protein